MSGEYSAIWARVLDDVRKSLISGTEKAMLSLPLASADCLRYIRRSPSRCGSGRRSTPRTALKITVLAPMPRPRVTITASANPRARTRLRMAYLRSSSMLSPYLKGPRGFWLRVLPDSLLADALRRDLARAASPFGFSQARGTRRLPAGRPLMSSSIRSKRFSIPSKRRSTLLNRSLMIVVSVSMRPSSRVPRRSSRNAA